MQILKKAGFESVDNLPRPVTAVGFSSKAYENLLLQLRLSITSDGEQRVRVLVPKEQGLHCITQFLMQEYPNLVDWKILELSSTERRCKASVQTFERSPAVWEEWTELTDTLAKFQAARGKETSGNEGSDNVTSKQPNANRNQTQAQWSSAAKVWQEVTCRILSPTC